jgi:hypothetical protein
VGKSSVQKCAIAFCALSCLISSDIFSDTCCENHPLDDHMFLIEAEASYFHPTKKLIRKIYSNGMGLYGLEASMKATDWLYPWISGSYLHEKGHSIGAHSSTKVTLVPLGIGLKAMYNFGRTSLYAAAGPLYSHIHMKDEAPFVIESRSKWDWGGIGKVGVYFFSRHSFFVDLFADYSYMKFHFHNGSGKTVSHDVNFSGWAAGGAIGFAI